MNDAGRDVIASNCRRGKDYKRQSVEETAGQFELCEESEQSVLAVTADS